MPVKMTKCCLCDKEVTKRSTLELRNLGCEKGRACRSHKMVTNLVIAYEERENFLRKVCAVDDKFRVINIVTCVRVFKAFLNIDSEVVYNKLFYNGVPFNIIEEARRQVDKLGPMSNQEKMEAISTVGMIQNQYV